MSNEVTLKKKSVLLTVFLEILTIVLVWFLIFFMGIAIYQATESSIVEPVVLGAFFIGLALVLYRIIHSTPWRTVGAFLVLHRWFILSAVGIVVFIYYMNGLIAATQNMDDLNVRVRSGRSSGEVPAMFEDLDVSGIEF